MTDDIDVSFHIPRSTFWSGVIAIIGSGIVFASTVTVFAFDVKRDVEEIKTEQAATKGENIDKRLTVVEENIKYTAETVKDIKEEQREINSKLNTLLRRTTN